jgi:hypothetical protein
VSSLLYLGLESDQFPIPAEIVYAFVTYSIRVTRPAYHIVAPPTSYPPALDGKICLAARINRVSLYEKDPQYTQLEALGRPQNWSGHSGAPLTPSGNQAVLSYRLACGLVTVSTELEQD